MIVKFTRKFVDKLRDFVLDRFGGLPGVLNNNNIDSALDSPWASFGGIELYDTDLKKCCKLYHALIHNHGYVDGNKRVGAIVFLYALDTSGICINKITNNYIRNTAMLIAAGKLTNEQLYELTSDLLNLK